jgi:uncharacterized protein (UPF0548 family)
MLSISRPSKATIARLQAEAQDMSLSYGPIGIARARSVAGFRVDETTVVVGRGEADFARAVDALTAWKHMRLDWLDVIPREPSIDVGTTVLVMARHFGLWSLNACRVVYSVEESTGVYTSFGFAYGTLGEHVVRGEEIFEARYDRRTGDVAFRIRAASQPRVLLAKIGGPLARHLQERFRKESCDALRVSTASG